MTAATLDGEENVKQAVADDFPRPDGEERAQIGWAARLVQGDPSARWNHLGRTLGAGLALSALYGVALGARQGGLALFQHALGVPLGLLLVALAGAPSVFIFLSMCRAPIDALSIGARHQELLSLLSREEFSREVAERKLQNLERQGASARVRASARLHFENVRRLHHLAERDARALDELSGLVDALRTQLVLVRLSGSSAEGVGDIVSELWARIQTLSEASNEVLLPGSSYVETTA